MSEPKPKRPRRKRLLLNLLLLLALLFLVTILLAVFALQRPGFYVSASQREPQKLTRDACDFSRKVQDFVSAVWSEQDFPLELTEDEVNGYLAAANDDAIWDRLPLRFSAWRDIFRTDWLRNLQVSFRKGRVTVAGEVTYAGFDVVLSLIGVPRVDGEGRVRLNVEGLRAGWLPLPRTLMPDLLRGVHDRPIPSKSSRWRMVSVEVKDGKACLLGEPPRGDD